MNRSGLLAAGALALVLVLCAVTLAQPRETAAFDNTWVRDFAFNVSSYGLWDDIAEGESDIPTSSEEAGLIWFKNTNASQTLRYHTSLNINPATYPVFTARAAVSDGSALQIFAYEPLGDNHECDAGTGSATSLSWTAGDADGLYHTKTAHLPNTNTVYEICITLNKQSASIANGRSSALIDYINLQDDSVNVGWNERFDGAP